MLVRVRWRGGHPKLRNEAVSADYIKEAFRPERLRKHHDHLHTMSQPVTQRSACAQRGGGGVRTQNPIRADCKQGTYPFTH